MKKILGILFLTFCMSAMLFGQDTVVSGNVFDESGEALIGATVKVPGTTIAAITGLDGDFTITAPSPDSELEVSYVGYLNQKFTASDDLSNIRLKTDAFGIDAVIVTGTGIGTETKKLGYVVEKVGGAELEEVPAANPANALRAKAPGITIVQASGNPAYSTDIRLRGATSINGSAAPLIIVDGIITNGDLRDINMEDVASIEVVKGAAASSLYGSRAGNGAVQIITKRGRGLSKPTFNLRTEYGFTQLQNNYPSATRHPFLLDSDGEFVIVGGTRQPDPDGLFDNEYPALFDNNNAFITDAPYNTIYGSFSNSGESSNFHMSYQRTENSGVVEGLDPYIRDNFRGNIDIFATDKLTAKFTAAYATSDGVDVNEQGQGQFNYFYSGLLIEPFIDITERDAEGNFTATPLGFDALGGSNISNPLYVTSVREFGFTRGRILGRGELNYSPLDWLSFRAAQSLDKDDQKGNNFVPLGFQDPNTMSTLPEGLISKYDSEQNYLTTELDMIITRNLTTDLKADFLARYMYEDSDFIQQSLSGRTLSANINAIDFADQATISAGDFESEFRAKAYAGNLKLDWKDKLILDGLFRYEAYSQNGPENLWNPYGRVSLGYILSEDIQLKGIDYLKLRGAYGTAGNRPGYNYIYTRSTPTSTGVVATATGNPDLSTSTTKDIEVGFSMTFLDRFNLEATYVDSETTNDFLFQNFSPTTGSPFTGQWLNLGEIGGTGYEISLQGDILRKEDMNWEFGLSWDKEETVINDLGSVAPFTASGGSAVNIFRYQEGESIGSLYGNQFYTSLDQVRTDSNGDVMVHGEYQGFDYTFGSSTNIKPGDLVLNSDGYVVLAGSEGTSSEQPLMFLDDQGEKATVKIGDTVPDFKVGLSSNFKWKGFSLYGVADWKQGGDVYNFTKQLLYFNERHQDLVESGLAGKNVDYLGGNSEIYNGANPVDYFVEDGSFLKIREIAAGYTFSQDQLNGIGIGDAIQEVKLNLSGRNLFTFTDYTGWDPEVALGQNSTYFALDEYSYPNFSTVSGTLSVKF